MLGRQALEQRFYPLHEPRFSPFHIVIWLLRLVFVGQPFGYKPHLSFGQAIPFRYRGCSHADRFSQRVGQPLGLVAIHCKPLEFVRYEHRAVLCQTALVQPNELLRLVKVWHRVRCFRVPKEGRLCGLGRLLVCR